jgi:predicted enzyme related to lactoylglutathione lyase
MPAFLCLKFVPARGFHKTNLSELHFKQWSTFIRVSTQKWRVKMANNPVGWFEIYVQDMPRAKAFYEAVLKLSLEPLMAPGDDGLEMVAFPMHMDVMGAPGSLVKTNGFPSGGNSTLVYFSCSDCGDEAGRVVAAGGKIEKEKMSIGEYGFIALAYDTEGNMFGLHSHQ